jgi:uncharacterized protein YjbI with pentapeptide repeats
LAWRTGLCVALALVCLVQASDARAACTDPPAPEVNWQRCILDGQDLRDVDLSSARLRDASFFRADLSRSDLTGVSGFKAKFFNAVMREAKLDEAKLSEADFTKADLTGASMAGADLRRVRFFDAVLREADLTGARLTGADMTRANLSGATWVDGKRVCAEGSLGRCN